MQSRDLAETLSRRGFLRVGALSGGAGLLAACAPAAAPAPAQPATGAGQPGAAGGKPAFEQEWAELIKAATKEGEIVYDVTRSTSGMGKEIIPAFQEAFPGIRVTQTTSDSAAPFAEKVLQEQAAGVYSWDLLFMSNAPFTALMPRGALAPIRPLIVHPDVLETKNWNGGFDAGWSDEAKQWGYGFVSDIGQALWIDTNQVAAGEMKTIQEFLNPKWKGKIAMADPRINGFGYGALSVARKMLGNDVLKRILIDQQPALSRDTRQVTEWVIRGTYAMGIGVVNTVLADFAKEGVGRNVKFALIPEFTWLSSSKPVWLPKQVPHPNAAKLFVNWLLTKPGQMAYNKSTPFNSRRLDVPVGTPENYPDPKAPQGFSIDNEAGSKFAEETIALCKEVLK